MVTISRTNPQNPDFTELITILDRELTITDGEDHAFYDQFNKSDTIKYAIVLYENNIPVGCGAIKEFDPEVMEVKRMFTLGGKRGKGYASRILGELEKWASETGYKKCILETGVNQPEAISLYLKNNYESIENYGQYAGIDKSLCFGKLILECFNMARRK